MNLWIYLWFHLWIQWLWRYSEIMAEFLKMNSHMKSWLNSLFLNWSGFSLKSVSVRGKFLLIQSNHDPFLAFSLLPALKLLHCTSVATWQRGCNCRSQMLCTARQAGCGGPSKHTRDVNGVEFCWACLSWIKETLENFKLRDYWRDQPQGHYPDCQWAIRSL